MDLIGALGSGGMGVSLGIVTIACADNLLKSNRVVVTLCTLASRALPGLRSRLHKYESMRSA